MVSPPLSANEPEPAKGRQEVPSTTSSTKRMCLSRRSGTVVILLALQAVLMTTVFRGSNNFAINMAKLRGGDAGVTTSWRGGTSNLKGIASQMTFDDHFRKLYQYHAREIPNATQAASQVDECGPFPYDKYFGQGQQRRSRLNEDKIVFETFFKDVPHEELKTYKYIEMGGFNGMDESNSRFYETCLNWEGLLVEPNPYPFQQLLVNRPHAHKASYAASCSAQDAVDNKTISFYNYIWSNAAQVGTNNAYTGGHTVDVPCGPIHPVVLDVLGPRVHFFSLDVEGAEPLVLEAMDFDAIFVDVLIVEIYNSFCPVNQPCVTRNQTRNIMHANGYHRFEDVIPASDLHVHPKSPLLAKILQTREPTQRGA